jgi:hypothetical protein
MASPTKIEPVTAILGVRAQTCTTLQTGASIPEELRSCPQWVAWKLVENPGAKKPRKLPINPHTGGTASSTDPATWSDYALAVKAVASYRLAGIGFVFAAGDPYAGIDLDNCCNLETGEIAEWAQEIIDTLASYAETSPSKTGVKIILKGKLPTNAKHNAPCGTGSVEMYDTGRFFTVTGQHLPGTPTTVENRQAPLMAVYETVFGSTSTAAAKVEDVASVPPSRHNLLRTRAAQLRNKNLSEEEILACLRAANNQFKEPKPDKELQDLANWVSSKNGQPALSPVAGASGYELVPLRELMDRPDAPVDYLLEGRLVAGTVSAGVAKPKVGKSTFARNLSLSVATGKPFLGCAVAQGEVIYLALEERPEEIKADFKAMGATGDEPIHVHAAQAPEAAMPELVGIVQNRKPRLVVIDPLFRLARIRDEKAYAETYQALGPLIDVARETGTHIHLTHHAGKSIKADAIDAPLGSTALGAIVSTLVVLKRTDAYRTIQTVQRIGSELPEIVLSFNPTTRTLSLGESKVETEQANAEKRILEYLEETSAPQTQRQIRDNVEGQTRVIRAALTSLTKSEKVKRTGEGKRGKPHLYERWFSGSQHIAGTREPETEDDTQPCINTQEKVVPEKSGYSEGEI